MTCVIQSFALLLQVNAHLSNDLCELLYVVLHEVGLRFVVLLDTVELFTVLVPYLIYVRIDKLDVTLILLLGLARHKLRMAQLLLQGGLKERSLGLVRRRGGHRGLNSANLSLQLLQLNHLRQVVLLGEEHLSARLVQSLPNLLRPLQQDAISCRIVLAVQISRFNQVSNHQVRLKLHLLGHV